MTDKIYQVCKEYYDYPGSEILKTFSSKQKANDYIKEYKKSDEWKNATCDECLCIHEYSIE